MPSASIARRAQPPRHHAARRSANRLAHVASRRHDPRFHAQVTLATVFALALGAFLHVVEDYLDNDPIVRWDVEFSRWLHLHSDATLLALFRLVTWAGNVATLAVLVIAVSIWLIRRRRVNEAALVMVSAAGIELLNAALKLLFHRPRPELAYVHLDTYSFPSGHTAGSAAIYGVVLYLLASRILTTGRRVAVAVGYLTLIVLIGFSRLYLEVHYLSDVLAGASLGAAWAAGSLFVYEMKREADLRSVLPSRLAQLLERFAN